MVGTKPHGPAAPPVQKRATVGVRRVTPSDAVALKDFQTEHFGSESRQADPLAAAWRYRPASEEYGTAYGAGPLLWVCPRDGRIVGQQGGLPATVVAAGLPIKACWAIDLMVEPAWRLRGVGPALAQAIQEVAPLTLGIAVSEAAQRSLMRAGWLGMGPVPRLVRLIRPLTEGQAPLGTSWTVDRRTARLSRLAAPLLAAYDAVTIGWMRAGTTLCRVNEWDDAVEAVWQRAAPHYQAIVRRDLPTLRWRFDEAPHAAAYQRHLMTRRGTAVAYALTRKRGDALTVVDYLGAPEDIGALFAHLLHEARRSGASALTCLAMHPSVQAQLRRLGFLRRPGPQFMIRADTAAGLPVDVLREPSSWYLTEADSDTDHMMTA